MSKTDNIYIKKARQKRLIKRIILILILLIMVALYIVFYTKNFLINNVVCTGDNLLIEDYVLDKSKKIVGDNIFTINKDEIEKTLKENPYVQEVDIIRKFPKTLEIKVKEATGLFYIKEANTNSIISSNMILLEKISDIAGKELIEISGIDISMYKIGDRISNNSRISNILKELYDEQGIIKDKEEDFLITAVNLLDLSQIKVYINNIEIQLGSDENIRKKMSDAITVYKSNLAKEYINVSFDGTPDFK